MNRAIVGWSVWVVVTIAWTVALTSPVVGPAFGDTEEMRNLTRIIFAKSAHVSVYAVWAFYTGWLKPSLRIRLFLLMFLMAHAVGTEWRQMYVERRTGLLRDAALDQFGIFIGVVAGLRWWAAPDDSNGRSGDVSAGR
jgi:VanZ family protein